MIWAVAILAILAALFFVLYQKVLSETRAVRSMFIMAVFDPQFSQGQRDKTMDYLKSIKANNAMEVSAQFNSALDNMAVRLAKSTKGSVLLGAHAALWAAFKEAKQKSGAVKPSPADLL